MTTTTRTMTRKTPWAAALTALLAVLALVFGVMAFAGVANASVMADQPDDPGKSETAPGHTGTPPGQDENFVPPGQEDRPTTDKKVWICHADANKGNGNTNLGVENDDLVGTGGENKTGFNVLYISVNAWNNAHDKLHPADTGPYDTEALALAACGTVTPPPPTPPPATPPSASTGITPEQAAAIDAAIGTVVPEPATVAPVEPAKVAVPAAAKPMPATVPAGDGSSVPQAPAALLALLALATAAAVTSGLRVAKNR